VKALITSAFFTIIIFSPALADKGGIPNGGVGQGNGNGNKVHGAPAPLLGAGIPGLVLGAGYGAYWLLRRRRSAS